MRYHKILPKSGYKREQPPGNRLPDNAVKLTIHIPVVTLELSLFANYKTMSKKLYSQGLVQIYTGNGKGKTSAALGLAVRAIGHGAKVHIIFFMKGNFPYGELDSLSKLPGVTYQTFGHEHFVDPRNIKAEEKEQARAAMEAASKALISNKFDLVVLDEINVASAWKLIEVNDVLALIASKPKHIELLLTGRYADQRLIDNADLVTNMEEVKHPYSKGIEARKGIEY